MNQEPVSTRTVTLRGATGGKNKMKSPPPQNTENRKPTPKEKKARQQPKGRVQFRNETAASTQPPTLRQLISDWDAMLVAKHMPGCYNVPFVSDMNRTSASTGIIHSAITVQTAVNGDDPATIVPKATAALSTFNYVVILYAPTLSSCYGSGEAYQFASTVKLGGLFIGGTTSPTKDFLSQNCFSSSIMTPYSLQDIYGGSGQSIAENAFIWSSALEVTLAGAQSTISGVARLGHFTMSSIQDRELSHANPLSVNDLLKAVTRTIDLKKSTKFTLQSAIVNHSLVNKQDLNYSPTTDDSELGGEVVAFAIIEKPFISNSTGANATYTMDFQLRSNFAFMPKIWDAFSRALAASAEEDSEVQLAQFGRNRGRRQGPTLIKTTRTTYQPTTYVFRNPGTLHRAWNVIRDFYNNNKEWINPLIATSYSFARSALLAVPERLLDPEPQHYQNVAALKEHLQLALSFLRDPMFRERYPSINDMISDYHYLQSIQERQIVLPQLQHPVDSEDSIELPPIQRKAALKKAA